MTVTQLERASQSVILTTSDKLLSLLFKRLESYIPAESQREGGKEFAHENIPCALREKSEMESVLGGRKVLPRTPGSHLGGAHEARSSSCSSCRSSSEMLIFPPALYIPFRCGTSHTQPEGVCVSVCVCVRQFPCSLQKFPSQLPSLLHVLRSTIRLQRKWLWDEVGTCTHILTNVTHVEGCLR